MGILVDTKLNTNQQCMLPAVVVSSAALSKVLPAAQGR